MTTCAEWATKLAAAEAALESLILGGKVVSVRDGENEVKFSEASRKDLIALIQFLQGKVDACNGLYINRRRAFGVIPLG